MAAPQQLFLFSNKGSHIGAMLEIYNSHRKCAVKIEKFGEFTVINGSVFSFLYVVPF